MIVLLHGIGRKQEKLILNKWGYHDWVYCIDSSIRFVESRAEISFSSRNFTFDEVSNGTINSNKLSEHVDCDFSDEEDPVCSTFQSLQLNNFL